MVKEWTVSRAWEKLKEALKWRAGDFTRLGVLSGHSVAGVRTEGSMARLGNECS